MENLNDIYDNMTEKQKEEVKRLFGDIDANSKDEPSPTVTIEREFFRVSLTMSETIFNSYVHSEKVAAMEWLEEVANTIIDEIESQEEDWM